jgi:hypothetical protein
MERPLKLHPSGFDTYRRPCTPDDTLTTIKPAVGTGDLQDGGEGFRALFAVNPQPMWVYDLETLSFLEVNDCAIAKYGYARDEFLAMRITEIRPEEDIPALVRNLARQRSEMEF